MPGVMVTVGHAALAWEGFNRGGAPLDLRLSDITIHGHSDAVGARISRLRVTLAPLPLLRGRIAPIRIVAKHPTVVFRPSLANPGALSAPPEAIGRLLSAISQLPRAGALDPADLRRIRIDRAHLIIEGTANRPGFVATDGTLELTRTRANVTHGTASANFRHGGQIVPIVMAITARHGFGTVRATLGPVDPAAIAPAGSALARLDLPISLTAQWPIGRSAPARLDLVVHAGSGSVNIGAGTVPVAAIDAEITATPDQAHLTSAVVILKNPNSGNGPTARLTGTLALAGALTGTIDATVDHATATALPAYWPAGLANDARQYVIRNIRVGTVSNGRFHAAFTLGGPNPGFGPFTGTFDATGITLDWFKQAVPITDLAGTLDFTGNDALVIHTTAGHLGRMGLRGTMVITTLSQHDQNAEIAATLDGPVAGAVALLDALPLQLGKNGVALENATGHITAKIDASLPLKKNLVLSDVHLATTAALTGLRLPLPIAGLALDHANMTLTTSLHHLSLHGAGRLADAPATFTAAMELPDGRFDLTAHATAGPQSLESFGVLPGIWRDGTAPLTIAYHDKSGTGSLEINGNLTGTSLAIPQFGWSKRTGIPGHATLRLTFANGKPTAIDAIDITAPDLDLRGEQRGRALIIKSAHLNDLRASGTIMPPKAAGRPWRLTLAGPTLDLSSLFDRIRQDMVTRPVTNTHFAPQRAMIGLPWRLKASFDHLRLGTRPAPSLGPINLAADGTESGIAALAAAVRISPSAGARLNYAKTGDTSRITIESADAGALLTAIGTTTDVEHGKLTMTATGTGAITIGRATLSDFRLRHAPVMAKVLQGLSLYGVPAATSGPGLAITHLIAPFRIEGSVVTLKNGRAYSPSLGFTATGRINLAARRYDLSGTIVPAYALNTLPGRLPIIGKLFSPEKGSGLFAARYTMIGPFASPHITVNPLSALAPGFIRGIFGIGPPKPAAKP